MTDSQFPTDPVQHSTDVESIREKTEMHHGKEQTIFDVNPEAKNSMVYWYPPLRDAIQDIDDIHIPETLFVDITPINVYELVSETEENMSDAEVDAIARCPAEWDVNQIQRAIDHIGCPAFLRTDTDSDKHNIEEAGRVKKNTEQQVDDTMNALIRGCSGNSGMMGAPRFNYLAVREWIDIDSSFTAFNGTPIGPEVRVFVEDSVVDNHYFYWPFHEERMQNAVDNGYDNETEQQVKDMQTVIDTAMDDLLRDATVEISTHFDGCWSVDFALTTSGDWYCIDMARGEDSWRPETNSNGDVTVELEDESIMSEADALLQEMNE